LLFVAVKNKQPAAIGHRIDVINNVPVLVVAKSLIQIEPVCVLIDGGINCSRDPRNILRKPKAVANLKADPTSKSRGA
jgi:hypothetical protein